MTRNRRAGRADPKTEALFITQQRLVRQSHRILGETGTLRSLSRSEQCQAISLAADLKRLIGALTQARETAGGAVTASSKTVSASLAYLTTGRTIAARLSPRSSI